MLYRANQGGPLRPARVMGVFWGCENGVDNTPNLAGADPWPMVRLAVLDLVPDADSEAARRTADWTAPQGALVDTWEARLHGSPGWLPLDWETWPRPGGDKGLIT